MRVALLISAAVLGLASAGASLPAAAQTMPNNATGARPGNDIGTGQSLPMSNSASNISPADARGIAPNLPAPPVPEGSPPRVYLQAARQALVAGRTGEAQEALERAETRALDRSVNPANVNDPSQQPLVAQITAALQALSVRDRARTIQLIDQALQGLGG